MLKNKNKNKNKNINFIYIFIIILIIIRALLYFNFQYEKLDKNFHELSNSNQEALFEKDARFHPVIGNFGVVATQEAIATQVGIDILNKGGNAVDAAVAIGYALGVTLPRAGNIGGGGFMLIWDAKNNQAFNINYRERAPKNISPKDFLDKDNQVNKNLLASSYKSVGIPGTVYGLNLAHEKFGSKNLSLTDILTPAIKLAEKGIPVSYAMHDALSSSKNRLNKDLYTKNIFYKNNKILEPNELLIQKDLALTLKRIAKNGTKEFYNGKTAELFIKAMQENKGLISKDDLKNYKAVVSSPIISSYKKYKIISTPLPSSGGIAIIELLNILENLDFSKIGLNSAKYIHYLVEAMNYAFYDRNYNLGDPDYVKNINNIVNKIISKQHAKGIFNKINPNAHTKSELIDKNIKLIKEGTNTTHYVVIDKEGNIVSNTYSLNYSFGIAKAVPKAGFLLNNVIDDFTIKANEPNAYGLIQDEENLVGPNRQPLSSMAPTIVLDENNKPIIATGSPGGSRIITTVLQVILNVLEYDFNIAASVASPRIHSQLWPDKILYEEGISSDTVDILKKMGHKMEQFRAMGSAQTASVSNNSNLLFATADPRREGSLALALNK